MYSVYKPSLTTRHIEEALNKKRIHLHKACLFNFHRIKNSVINVHTLKALHSQHIISMFD